MSRSYRYRPKMSFVLCASEKEDKKAWHRKFRRINRTRIKQGLEPKHYKEVSDPWEMGKDGSRVWFGHYKYGKSVGRKWWDNHEYYEEEEVKDWYKKYMRK